MRIIGAGTREGVETVERARFWTIPNVITMVRFLCVPFFVYFIVFKYYAAAFIILVVLGSTDWIDGYVARRFNMVSKIGKWLDPAADRLALIIVAITFAISGIAPLWLVLCIVVPDALLIINSLILFRGSPGLPVSAIGKIRTTLLLVGTPLLLLYRVPGCDFPWLKFIAYTLLILGCFGHCYAAADYFVKAWKKFLKSKESPQTIDSKVA